MAFDDAPEYDESISTPYAFEALWTAVVSTAIHDLFAPRGPTAQERHEAYLFLTAETGDWAKARLNVCAQTAWDPNVLRSHVVAILEGRRDLHMGDLPASKVCVETARAYHRSCIDEEQAKVEAARIEQDRRRRIRDERRAKRAEEERRQAERLAQERAILEERQAQAAAEAARRAAGKPVARLEFVEVQGVPVGHVVVLERWQADEYCSILDKVLPSQSTATGRALALATQEGGMQVRRVSENTIQAVRQAADLVGLEVVLFDEEGDVCRFMSQAKILRLRLPPRRAA